MLQFTLFFFVFYDQLVVDVSFLAIKMSKSVGATEKAVWRLSHLDFARLHDRA